MRGIRLPATGASRERLCCAQSSRITSYEEYSFQPATAIFRPRKHWDMCSRCQISMFELIAGSSLRSVRIPSCACSVRTVKCTGIISSVEVIGARRVRQLHSTNSSIVPAKSCVVRASESLCLRDNLPYGCCGEAHTILAILRCCKGDVRNSCHPDRHE